MPRLPKRGGTSKAKPKKPYPDYPLTAHPVGQWCKKIHGRLYYFGPLADPVGALNKFKDQQDDLYAGRAPGRRGDGLTLGDACNLFLDAKRTLVDTGEISYRQWHEYYSTFEMVLKHFGKQRPMSSLRPEDMTQLRGILARGRGLESLGNHVQRVRGLLNWLWDNDHIDKPIKTGTEFKRPDKTARRKAKLTRPKRLFAAAEIRAMIDGVSTQMRAMILLGINCGFGNADCADLPIDALDLARGIVHFPRPKTAVDRLATLWPETIKALKAVLAERQTPKSEDHANLVFLTRCGLPWVRFADQKRRPAEGDTKPHGTNINAVTGEFGKIMRKLGIRRRGVSFYALRHTFETVAGETRDQPAVDRIMGHARDSTMPGLYTEWTGDRREDKRLRRVTSYVHKWLFAGV